MEGEFATPVLDAGSEGTGRSAPPGSARPKPSWWLVTALVACISLVVGGTVQHYFDQKDAASNLYRSQVLTTVFHFLNEESGQLRLPVSHRSAQAFGNLAAAISSDPGVNGQGNLNVSLGSGSVGQPIQIIFSATITSAYASTTVAVWSIYVSKSGGSSSDSGSCVLSSTLLGPGRARSDLNLGGHEFLSPCANSLWSRGPVTATQPRFALAGIPRSPS